MERTSSNWSKLSSLPVRKASMIAFSMAALCLGGTATMRAVPAASQLWLYIMSMICDVQNRPLRVCTYMH